MNCTCLVVAVALCGLMTEQEKINIIFAVTTAFRRSKFMTEKFYALMYIAPD